MGLPGSGKTTLAQELQHQLLIRSNTVTWFNADRVRRDFNDWDFSEKGRIRQATRMYELAKESVTDYVIADFVCPLPEMRDIFGADYTVWMDTILYGRFQNTNNIFVPPKRYEMRVNRKDVNYFVPRILHELTKENHDNDDDNNRTKDIRLESPNITNSGTFSTMA